SMATDYVTEVRRVQPRGPYFLAGYSFGGPVSFEIAQQLVREGECVSFLGLIDPAFDVHDVPTWVSEVVRVSGKVRRVHSFQELLLGGLRYLRHQNRWYPLDLRLRLGGSIPYKYRRAYYDWIRIRARRNYVHRSYPGHITIFSAAGTSERHR